jgi:hypothetical protein
LHAIGKKNPTGEEILFLLTFGQCCQQRSTVNSSQNINTGGCSLASEGRCLAGGERGLEGGRCIKSEKDKEDKQKDNNNNNKKTSTAPPRSWAYPSKS